MTETKNETPEQGQPSSLQQEQVNMIRSSLLQHVFEKYHVLIGALQKLPIPQQIPGMQHAYLQIDGAMLWVKEVINTAPLMLAPATEKKEVCATNEKIQTEESEKQPEDSNQESETISEVA